MKIKEEEKIRKSIDEDNVKRFKEVLIKEGNKEELEVFEICEKLLEKIKTLNKDKRISVIFSTIHMLCKKCLGLSDTITILEIVKLQLFNEQNETVTRMAKNKTKKLIEKAEIKEWF